MSEKNSLIIREKNKTKIGFFFLMILIISLSITSVFLSGYSYYLSNKLTKPKPRAHVSFTANNKIWINQQINSMQAKIEVFAQQIDSLQKQAKQPIIVNTNLLSKISALQQEITTLPLKKALPRTSQASEKLSSSTWKKHLAKSLDQINSIIIIRHHDTPIEPQRSPEERALLNERLQLTFQEATWAVLQKNQTVYAWALKYIDTTSQQQFDMTQPETKIFLSTLNNLMQEKIISSHHETLIEPSATDDLPISDEKKL